MNASDFLQSSLETKKHLSTQRQILDIIIMSCHGEPNLGDLVTSGGSEVVQEGYQVLCPCSVEDGSQCQCKHRRQLWSKNSLIPCNWDSWPLIRKCLVGVAVATPIVWLIVYLVLHFYYSKDSISEISET